MNMLQTLIIDITLVALIILGIANEDKLVKAEDELWKVIKWAVRNPKKVLRSIERAVFG